MLVNESIIIAGYGNTKEHRTYWVWKHEGALKILLQDLCGSIYQETPFCEW